MAERGNGMTSVTRQVTDLNGARHVLTRQLGRGGQGAVFEVKGGRLAAACSAGTLLSLIISDVIGDPLEVIGSGPTIACVSRASDALQVLRDRRLLNQIPVSYTHLTLPTSDLV